MKKEIYNISVNRAGSKYSDDIESENINNAVSVFIDKYGQEPNAYSTKDKSEFETFTEIEITTHPEFPTESRPFFIEFISKPNKNEKFKVFQVNFIRIPEIEGMTTTGHSIEKVMIAGWYESFGVPSDLSMEGDVAVDSTVRKYNNRTFLKFMINSLNDNFEKYYNSEEEDERRILKAIGNLSHI